MPFGLRNAPATFQRLLQTLFKDLNLLPYLDDIVIASKTFCDHLQTVRNVLWKLRTNNLTLQPSKCKFAEFSTVYQGHLVSGDGIRPDPEKVAKLDNMTCPKNKRELGKFCGFTNYLAKYVQNYAEIMKPLFDLRKQRTFI